MVTGTELPGASAPAGAPAVGLLRGSALYAAAHVTGLAVSLVGNAMLVRVASQHEVASYLLFLQAVNLLGLVLQLGLVSTVLRFAPLARGRGGTAAAATLRRRVAAVQLAIWAAILPAVVLLWPALSRRVGAPELADVGTALAATGAIASLSRLLGAYVRSFRLYAAAAIFEQLGPRTFLALGLIVLYALGGGVSWVTLAALFSGALVLSLLAQAATLAGTTVGESSEPGEAQPTPPVSRIARMAVVVGGHVVAATLLTSVDLWVLSAVRTHQEVAVYGMMLSLLQVVTIGSLVAQFVVPQELSLLYAAGRRAELEELARTAATATLLFAAPAAAALALIGRPLIAGLLGEEYVAGWGVLVVLLVGRVWDAASGPAGSLLLMTGHHLRVTVTTFASTVLTVGLALALARGGGGYGVAAASSAGLIAVNAANVRAVRRLLGIRVTAYLAIAPYRRVLLQLVPRAWRRA